MFFQRIAVVALAVLGCFSSSATVSAQPTGQYFRPSGNQVTGNPTNWVANHRSPCPAMNTLANHGFINRNGKDLTPDKLRRAMMEVFNIDRSVADFVTNGLPNRFTLADLSRHNFIEHDASLVHADMFYRLDPSQVDGGLANDLLARMDENRFLGVQEVGEALRVRLIWCQQKQGGCDFRTNQRDITFREAAKLLLIFGANNNNDKISVEHAYSFLVNEMIPEDWQKAQRSVTMKELDKVSLQIQRVAGVASN